MTSRLVLLAVAIISMTALASMPSFKGKVINKHTSLPEGWLVQGNVADKKTVRNIIDQQGRSDKVAFQPQKSSLTFYSGNALSYEKDDSLQLVCKIKGTGKIKLGYYAYSDKGQYLFGEFGQELTLTGKEDVFTGKFLIKDGKDFATAQIRPAVFLGKGCNVELLDFSIVAEQ